MPRRSGHAKKIDTVHWTLIDSVFAGFAAGTSAVNLLAAQHLPETLLRIRGRWAGNLLGAQAPGVGLSVFAGIIQVPEGTGTTVLWSPFTDGDAPWIWWDVMHFFYNEAVVDVIASQSTLADRREVDSKAMRKLRNTELQIVLENVTMSTFSASSVNMSLSGRVLSGS